MQDDQQHLSPLQTELQQMGFPSAAVRQALQHCHNNKQQAINQLLQNNENHHMAIEQPNDDGFEDEEEQDYKMIFVMRMDLKLPLGKMAQLVATGTMAAYQQIQKCIEKDQLKEFAFFEWKEGGQKKIVVKAPTEQEVRRIIQLMQEKNINCYPVYEKARRLKEMKQEVKQPKRRKERKEKKEESGEIKSQKVEHGEKGEIKKEEQKIEQTIPIEKSKQKGKSQNTEEKMEQESKQVSKSQQEGEKTPQTKSKRQQKRQKKHDHEQKQPQRKELIPQQEEPQLLVLAACGPASQSELSPLTGHLKLL